MRAQSSLLLCLLLGCAASDLGSDALAAEFLPSPIPDRIVLTFADDPATTQTVTWRTDAAVGEPVAEVAVATAGPQFPKRARRVASATTPLGAARYHTATFRGLEPATKYAYRVGDGALWSEWSHFTTASAEPSPFSFVYFGDAQNDIKSHWSRVVREAFKDAPRAAFLLHAGDLVNVADSDREWGEWFYSAGWILRTMPSIATPGNHEYAGGRLSRNWRPTFEFPRNGPEGFDDTVYYVDYQGARIVSLDTSRELAAQAAWFDAAMRDCTARWKIVTMHFPVYSTAKDRDNAVLRDTLQPLFDRHGVDIVLQGHDHSYGRTGRVRHGDEEDDDHGDDHGDDHAAAGAQNVPTGVRAQSDESGTVYVVSVSGPKMYALGDTSLMARTAQNTQLYQVITVGHDELRYSAYAATGELFDRFTLEKAAGRPNRLVEQGPPR